MPLAAYTWAQAACGSATCEVAVAAVESVIASAVGYTSKWMCGQRPW